MHRGRQGACPPRRELKGTFCDGAPGDRKGRDGVNPSNTHLRVAREKMCRRGACPLATLAVVGSHATHSALKFALVELVPLRKR